MIGVGGKATTLFICPISTCKKSFSSRQALKEHKADTKGHWYCAICDRDFTNQDSIRLHVSLLHPHPQDLHCPGCGRHYTLFSGLIGHWENNECPNQNYNAATIFEEREKNLQFAHALRQQGLGEDSKVRVTTAPASVTAAQMPHIALSREPNVNPTIFRPGDFPPPSSRQYSYGDSKTPDLITGFDDMSLNDTLSSAPVQPTAPWGQGSTSKDLFSSASASAKLAPELAQDQARPDPNDPMIWSEHDPRNPLFDVGKYWDDAYGWFKCPHGCGGKKHRYPTGDRLISHLKSPTHRNVKIRCPKCFREFISAQALAQHAEQASRRCTINTTTQYHHFVGELSAGLIKPTGHHLDATQRYTTTQKAATGAPIGNVTSTAKKVYESTRQARQEAALKEREDVTYDGW